MATRELETLVLLAIERLGDGAYGVAVRDELEDRIGRRLSRGAVYTALRRLESKGWIEGRLGEVTRVRGGRAKRYVSLTSSGRAQLRSALADLDRMREGLEGLGPESVA